MSLSYCHIQHLRKCFLILKILTKLYIFSLYIYLLYILIYLLLYLFTIYSFSISNKNINFIKLQSAESTPLFRPGLAVLLGIKAELDRLLEISRVSLRELKNVTIPLRQVKAVNNDYLSEHLRDIEYLRAQVIFGYLFEI